MPSILPGIMQKGKGLDDTHYTMKEYTSWEKTDRLKKTHENIYQI